MDKNTILLFIIIFGIFLIIIFNVYFLYLPIREMKQSVDTTTTNINAFITQLQPIISEVQTILPNIVALFKDIPA